MPKEILGYRGTKMLVTSRFSATISFKEKIKLETFFFLCHYFSFAKNRGTVQPEGYRISLMLSL